MSDDVHAPFLQHYYAMFNNAESFCAEVAELISTTPAPGSFEAALDPDGPEKYAVMSADLYLHCCVDTILTWHRASKSADASIGSGIQGTAGLIRQVLECGATAAWLVADPALLKQRGFAALWEDMSEQAKFPQMIYEPNHDAKKADRLDRMLKIGAQHGLLNAAGDAPATTLLHKTDACIAIKLDEGSFGTGTAEAFYRWTSGMAHGLPWAALRQRTESVGMYVKIGPEGVKPTGEDLVIPRPNYLMLACSMLAAHHTINVACGRIQGLRFV
jgi:hypothetical protein